MALPGPTWNPWDLERTPGGFRVLTTKGPIEAKEVVIATNGYTTEHKIHSQFETQFVAANLHAIVVEPWMTPAHAIEGEMFDGYMALAIAREKRATSPLSALSDQLATACSPMTPTRSPRRF